ncbi:hypothetical protein EKK58_06410 [Candidatus Dependentiae bacterium]|nr:MAG: hypothetical protein EKK58_06410 [Candidatus Dependentiae bacterium]
MQTATAIIPTVQLYIGAHEQTAQKISVYLQSVFCSHNGCSQCTNCLQIKAKKHVSCLWLTSKKQYILDDLLPLQEKLQFSLAEDERFFFIIENAELLSDLSSNALLKALEEPPLGYYFILQAKATTELLPTVLSRCVIFYTKDNTVNIVFKPLLDHFTLQALPALLFLQELDRSKINEDQSHELCKQILHFWQKKYNSIVETDPTNTNEIVLIKHKLNVLYKAIEQLPTIGNAKLFWKNLLLQFDPLINS